MVITPHETMDADDQRLDDGDRGRIRRIKFSKKEQQHRKMRAINRNHRPRRLILSTGACCCVYYLFLGLSLVLIVDFPRHSSPVSSWYHRSSSTVFFAVAQEFDTKNDQHARQNHNGYDEDDDDVLEGDDDVYDEYLRAVLEEERQQHMQQNPYDNAYSDESDFQAYQEKLHRHAQEEESRQRAEQERFKKEQLLRIQHEREAAFQRELQTAATEQQKKMLQQQKAKDHALVRKVCRASQRGDLYSVLGLRNWQFQMGGWCWKFGKYIVKFPTWHVLNISSQHIRRAYRARALLVHPDKNRDARAQEAFVAVEEAASVLTDEAARKEYDISVKKSRQERLVHLQHRAKLLVQVVRGVFCRILKVMRTVLGPFTVPILVLGGILL
jgi:DnaJ domain